MIFNAPPSTFALLTQFTIFNILAFLSFPFCYRPRNEILQVTGYNLDARAEWRSVGVKALTGQRRAMVTSLITALHLYKLEL